MDTASQARKHGARGALAVTAALLLLAGCTSAEPPPCSDPVVDGLVRESLDANAGAVLAEKVDPRDPVSLLGLVTMGVERDPDGTFLVPGDPSATIRWRLARPRSTGLNPEVAIRSCLVDVAYGNAAETFGSFSLGYTVARATDGSVQVRITD